MEEGREELREEAEGEEFQFRGATHPDVVLAGLNSLRKENTFTDVRIQVDQTEFPVHKCVLSSFSPYFKAMFTTGLAETDQDLVTLNGVEAGMMAGLIEYAYTGEITINKHNVQNLLSAANLLEVGTT